MGTPQIDVEKCGTEIKNFLHKKKFDMIDYSYVDIEAYPSPDDPDYPELAKFAAAQKDFYVEYEKCIVDLPETEEVNSLKDVMDRLPDNLGQELKQYDDLMAQVEAAVNNDKEFWGELRKVILPLYERSPHFEAWQQRWQKIELSYDPIGLDVVTTQMWTNPETGERIRGDVLRKTEYPAGFVVKIH